MTPSRPAYEPLKPLRLQPMPEDTLLDVLNAAGRILEEQKRRPDDMLTLNYTAARLVEKAFRMAHGLIATVERTCDADGGLKGPRKRGVLTAALRKIAKEP